MIYSIPISEAMNAALSDHTKRYIKVTVTHDDSPVVFYPTKISGNASEEFQSWNVLLKNYGEYSEGLFADDLATVSFSHNNSDWVTMMTGYVSPEGMNREQGYVTDDIVSFDLVDRTKGKGTKRKPSSTVFAALKICDPSDASNSILHRLGTLMGITSFDAGLIQDVKDIIVLGEQVVWSELKLLRDAYKASMYFDYLGRLRFRSPLELGWTDPESEWTFVADPSHTLDSYSSRVIGKVRRTYNQVICNRAMTTLDLYEQRSLRVVYRDTTNWNGDLSQCSIVIQPGATYPESGVLSINYKDPLTGEEYPYATNIQTPSIGQSKAYDIGYSGGHLELISFNGSTSATTQQPGASQIILKNTGALSCEIIKFEVRGEPFFQLSENKVEEVDSSISDEVDYVDLSVDGRYATSVEQIDKVLSRHVEEGKIRTRHFSFASIFLPQIQREMVCTYIDVDGSEIACKVTTYSHKSTGKTLDTMKTYVELDEVLSYTPSYNPKHEVTPPNVIPPQKGAPGSSAKAVIILCDSDGLPVTSRGVPKIASIRFTLSLQNLTITEASDVTWVCSDPEVTLVAVPGDIYSVDLDTSEVSVDSFTVTATVSGIMGLLGISKRADGKPAPMKLPAAATQTPTVTPQGEPIVKGDFFVVAENFVEDGILYKIGSLWEYTGSGWILSEDAMKALTAMDDYASVANEAEDGVFCQMIAKRVYAQKGVIEELGAKKIVLKSDGTIESEDCIQGVSGFRINADGTIEAVGAMLQSGKFTGVIDSEPFTTTNEGTLGSGITFNSKTHFKADDYNATLSSSIANQSPTALGSGVTIDSNPASLLIRSEGTTYLQEEYATATPNNSNPFYHTLPINNTARYKIIMVGRTNYLGPEGMRLWLVRGGVETLLGYFGGANSSNPSVYYGNFIAGDQVKAAYIGYNTKTGSAINTSSGPYSLETQQELTNGVFFRATVASNPKHMYSFLFGSYYGNAIVYSGRTPSYNYAKATAFIAGVASYVINMFKTAQGTIVINCVPRTINGVMKTSTGMTVFHNAGSQALVLASLDPGTSGYYNITGTYQVQTSVEGAETKNLNAKEVDMYSIGTTVRYLNIAAKTMVAETFDNSSARAKKKDISPYLGSALDLLNCVQVVNYRYKSENGSYLHTGFIADDTPDLLTGADHKSMSLGDNIGVLIKAVQELYALIKETR